MDGKLNTASHGKRSRVDEFDLAIESVEDMDVNERITRGNKMSTITTSPLKFTQSEDGV
uniref:Uncharacterized protein n=1 Tax=Vitis vinifera TaxID=29760 RepID=F6GX77_VITVI